MDQGEIKIDQDQAPLEAIQKRGRGRPKKIYTEEELLIRSFQEKEKQRQRFRKYYHENKDKMKQVNRRNYLARRGAAHGFAVIPLDAEGELILADAVIKR